MKRKKNYKEYTIMLVGRIGAGKSSLGNFLLQKEYFNAGDDLAPVTAKSMCECRNLPGGITLRVIDTPGFGDFRSSEKVKRDLADAFYEAKDGVDAFIFVISSAERVGKDLVECFKLFEKFMEHEQFYSYVIPIFTKADMKLKKRGVEEIYSYEKQERLISAELENQQLAELKDGILKKSKQNWMCISSNCKDQFYYDHITKQLISTIEKIRIDTGGMACTSKIMLKAKELKEMEKTKNESADEEEMKRAVVGLLLLILINGMNKEEYESLFGDDEERRERMARERAERESQEVVYCSKDGEKGACGNTADLKSKENESVYGVEDIS